MDQLIYVLFISIFFPFLLMMLLVEKKARLPIVFLLIGLFISVFSAEVNGLFQDLIGLTPYDTTITLTPITEEFLKALPILIFALFISDKKETIFTASMAAGIGFAVLENAYYLVLHAQSFSILSALMRGFGTGLMHGMCTLMVGFGISFVKKKKKLFLAGTFALLATAVTCHSIFNMLVQSAYPVVGALLPIVIYLIFFIWRHFGIAGKEQGPG